jgi:7-cyano-7-deazaguanine synthase
MVIETKYEEFLLREKNSKEKSVIVLSGGLDSTVCAYIEKDLGYEIYGLSFDYGQKHSKELTGAYFTANSICKDWKVVKLDFSFNKSALLGSSEIKTDGIDKGIPSTWVPQRNSIFLAIAFGYAEVIGANRVITGVNSLDYSGYPDCRPEFIESMELSLNLASKKWVENRIETKIVTPIIHNTKKEIVQLGFKLKVPFKNTWSCYKGNDKACGVCDSCRIRLKAFEEAGLIDPVEYE